MGVIKYIGMVWVMRFSKDSRSDEIYHELIESYVLTYV